MTTFCELIHVNTGILSWSLFPLIPCHYVCRTTTAKHRDSWVWVCGLPGQVFNSNTDRRVNVFNPWTFFCFLKITFYFLIWLAVTVIFLYGTCPIQRLLNQHCGYWWLVCHQGISSYSAEYAPMRFRLFMGWIVLNAMFIISYIVPKLVVIYGHGIWPWLT